MLLLKFTTLGLALSLALGVFTTATAGAGQSCGEAVLHAGGSFGQSSNAPFEEDTHAGDSSKRLTGIRVWYHVDGRLTNLQATYTGGVEGTLQGTGDTSNSLLLHSFEFLDNERVDYIAMYAGDVWEFHLEMRTNHSRTFLAVSPSYTGASPLESRVAEGSALVGWRGYTDRDGVSGLTFVFRSDTPLKSSMFGVQQGTAFPPLSMVDVGNRHLSMVGAVYGAFVDTVQFNFTHDLSVVYGVPGALRRSVSIGASDSVSRVSGWYGDEGLESLRVATTAGKDVQFSGAVVVHFGFDVATPVGAELVALEGYSDTWIRAVRFVYRCIPVTDTPTHGVTLAPTSAAPTTAPVPSTDTPTVAHTSPPSSPATSPSTSSPTTIPPSASPTSSPTPLSTSQLTSAPSVASTSSPTSRATVAPTTSATAVPTTRDQVISAASSWSLPLSWAVSLVICCTCVW